MKLTSVTVNSADTTQSASPPFHAIMAKQMILHPSRVRPSNRLTKSKSAPSGLPGNENAEETVASQPWWTRVQTYFAEQQKKKATLAQLEMSIARLPTPEIFSHYFDGLHLPLELAHAVLWSVKPWALRAIHKDLSSAFEAAYTDQVVTNSFRKLLTSLLGKLPVNASVAQRAVRKLNLRHHDDKIQWERLAESKEAVKDVHQLINLAGLMLRDPNFSAKVFHTEQVERPEPSILSGLRSWFLTVWAVLLLPLYLMTRVLGKVLSA